MKNLALFISLFGLLSIFLYINFSIPYKITNSDQIKYLEDNQKTLIEGKIKNIKIHEKNILFTIENNLTINCDKPCIIKNKIGEEISILAKYNSFYNSFDFKEMYAK